MQKPAMPTIPGMEAMNDTLEYVRNLWGGMKAPGLGIPGMVMPTLSVEEIDKQIKDLKAVEAWLNVNMSMLRSTIQALEVQSATITTLQSMGQSLSGAMGAGLSGAKKAANGAAGMAADMAASVSGKAAAADDAKDEARNAARRKSRADLKEEFSKHGNPTAKDSSAADVPNPSLWWNMLQDQFKQAVSTAMSPDAGAAAMGNAARSAMQGMAKSMTGKAVAPKAAKSAKSTNTPAAKKAAVKKTPAKRK